MTTKDMEVLRSIQIGLSSIRNDLGCQKANQIGYGCSDKYTLNEEINAIVSIRRKLLREIKNIGKNDLKNNEELKKQVIEYRKKIKEYEKVLAENNILVLQSKCREIWSRLRRVSSLLHKDKESNDSLEEFENVKNDIVKYIPTCSLELK